MVSGQVHLARGDQKMTVDQVGDSIRQVGREVRHVVGAAILLQTTSDVDPRVRLAEGELYIGVSFIVPKQYVKAGLLLLDEVVFEGERFFVVVDDDVVEVD